MNDPCFFCNKKKGIKLYCNYCEQYFCNNCIQLEIHKCDCIHKYIQQRNEILLNSLKGNHICKKANISYNSELGNAY